jgi:hypothetical protein
MSASRKPPLALVTPADERIVALNQRYAFVLVGGQQCILAETDDGDFELLGVDAFRGWLASEAPVGRAEKWIPLSRAWLESPLRRSYRRIVFQPDADRVRPDEYNIWKGFAVTPRAEGSCDQFLAHLHDNVAQGNKDYARWITAWLAQIIQQPAKKPGTSLVLRGEPGVGKTIVGEVMRLLLRRHYVRIARSEQIVGRFNGRLKHALLLHADEGFWAGDRAAEGVLKDLITSDLIYIEFKGREAIELDNYIRLLVTSNAKWVVPAALDERRFAVFDVGQAKQKNRAYFGAMWKELTDDQYAGAGRLLDHFQRFDLSSIDLGIIPTTPALQEQKIHNLDSEEAWLLDLLQDGILPGDETGCGCCPRAILHDAYVDHAKRVGFARRSTATRLGMFLRRALIDQKGVPLVKDQRPQIDEGREYQYAFPSLTACREAFARTLHEPIDWDGPTVWMPWTSPSMPPTPKAPWEYP